MKKTLTLTQAEIQKAVFQYLKVKSARNWKFNLEFRDDKGNIISKHGDARRFSGVIYTHVTSLEVEVEVEE